MLNLALVLWRGETPRPAEWLFAIGMAFAWGIALGSSL